MSCRVNIVYRVVSRIGIAVEALRVVGSLDDGIRADEPANLRVIVSGVIEVEAGLVKFFAGEVVVDRRLLRFGRNDIGGEAAVRDVFAVLGLVTVLVSDDVG